MFAARVTFATTHSVEPEASLSFYVVIESTEILEESAKGGIISIIKDVFIKTGNKGGNVLLTENAI